MRAISLLTLKSPSNQRVVQFVREHGPISTVALADAQGVPADGLGPFVQNLHLLKRRGYLTQVSPDGMNTLWAWLGIAPPDTPDDEPPLLKPHPQRVPPRQNDVMHSPVWCPPPDHAPRPGSTDFLRVASRGYRC